MAAKKSTGGYELESSLSHLLRRAQQFAYDQFAQKMGDGTITPRQFIVLFAVNEEEGLSQTDLVNRTGIDRSTLADMISRMIKNGLLARKRTAEDARANAVRLTAAGRRALTGTMPRALAAERALLELLPKAAQTELLRGLSNLAAAIESLKTTEKPARAKATRRTAGTARKRPAKRAATTRRKAS